MKIGLVLHDLHRSEERLARQLLEVAGRHRGDHEVFHVAQDLARWSEEHLRAIAEAAQRYDVDVGPSSRDEAASAGPSNPPDEHRAGHDGGDGLRLLRDLREVAQAAYGVSTQWEMIAQAAQGGRDAELLATCQQCHPETLRQVRWANAMIKASSTQALLS